MGAVNVAFPLSEISTSKALPESAVTVCSIESELVTVIVAPGEALAVKKAQGVRLGRRPVLPSKIVIRIIENRAAGDS